MALDHNSMLCTPEVLPNGELHWSDKAKSDDGHDLLTYIIKF